MLCLWLVDSESNLCLYQCIFLTFLPVLCQVDAVGAPVWGRKKNDICCLFIPFEN